MVPDTRPTTGLDTEILTLSVLIVTETDESTIIKAVPDIQVLEDRIIVVRIDDRAGIIPSFHPAIITLYLRQDSFRVIQPEGPDSVLDPLEIRTGHPAGAVGIKISVDLPPEPVLRPQMHGATGPGMVDK